MTFGTGVAVLQLLMRSWAFCMPVEFSIETAKRRFSAMVPLILSQEQSDITGHLMDSRRDSLPIGKTLIIRSIGGSEP